jgi:hypothetical protein
MDEYEVIYLDDDERNAVKDHRRTTGGSRRRPGGRSVVVPASNRPTVIRHHGGGAGGGEYYAERRPQPQVVVQPAARSGLAGFSTGELIELAAQLLAAIQPLPGAPSAQGHMETDVENLVVYQTALATHAKRDEQLRTLGGMISRLLR